ncbi:MAG TPA: TorF family putative porin [Gallionella sp.]|nr:TorF family putative porin [Gallionella sp.]
MMKSKLLNTMILAALAVPGVAMAADAPPVTGNVALVTDYLYRGISQTGGKPAIQGGFDYAHPSGFYIGAWGSNISWLPASSASLELDTYLGFKNSFASDFNYDVGFLRYNYPGYYVPGATKGDTNEIYGLIGWKWVTLKYSYSLGDTFGIAADKGSSYVDLSASYTLEGSGVILGAHYGKQTFKAKDSSNLVTSGYASDGADYSDYNVSVAKDFSGFVVGLKYSDTNAKKDGWYTITQADGSTTDTGKSTVVLSVTHAM